MISMATLVGIGILVLLQIVSIGMIYKFQRDLLDVKRLSSTESVKNQQELRTKSGKKKNFLYDKIIKAHKERFSIE